LRDETEALEAGEEYGVWAGVKLPGGQYRKRHQLARAHEVLRDIAAGRDGNQDTTTLEDFTTLATLRANEE
jgi:hypothetical protein